MEFIRLPDLPFALSRPVRPGARVESVLVEPFILGRLKAVSKDLWA
jgi:hypothetical protein